MAAGRIIVPPYFPARGRDDQLLPGALLYVYSNGTTDKIPVYTDSGLSIASTNPVIANASAQFPAVWAEAGTEASPVLYRVAVTAADGASPGNVFVFDDYRPSVDFETAALALSEAYAGQAQDSAAVAVAAAVASDVSADLSEAAYQEILDFAAASPESPSIVNKVNLDGANVPDDLAFRTNTQSQRQFSNVLTDYANLSSLITSVLSGTLAYIPAGAYATAPVTLDLSGNTQEPMDDQKRPSLRGAGAGSTVIKGNTAGQYALTVVAAAGVSSHSYQVIGDFSIGRTVLNANGMKLKNFAFIQVQNMQLQSMDTGLYLESVLSSKFDNLVLQYNRIGMLGAKGTGFSDVNANGFYGCKWRENTELAAQYGDTSGLNVYGGSTEGNGTQAQVDQGGWLITVTGAEGGVGANFDGHYFEGNKGGFDVRITNGGADYVSHIFKGCIFNRISSTAFVTNHIQSVGKNRIVFDSCDFRALGTYARNAGRQIVSGDANTIFVFRNCSGLSNIDTTDCVNEEERDRSGIVSVTGTAVTLPKGWSCSRVSLGVFLVTHPIGDTKYTVLAFSEDTIGGTIAQRSVNKTSTTFQVITVNTAGALADVQFAFQVHRYGGQN